MRFSTLLLMSALVLLTACGKSYRPTYSGHQEPTEGVPGFVDGKKVSPHVKLGQSYTIDGETYVPRHEPDYVEEGMASWYGPGFHGGKTANGEVFDKHEMTAAHRTLPLPSIVRVTMVATGKQVYVRINDRGPFAHSRIIDLSRAAADEIGLLRDGVAKVRVEYMAAESRRFTDLLAEGRDPKSIDIASEVLNYNYAAATPQPAPVATPAPAQQYAANYPVKPQDAPRRSGSFWDSVIPSAEAAEPAPEAAAAPVDAVSEESNTPELAAPEPLDTPEESPFDMVAAPPAREEAYRPTQVAALPPQSSPPPSASAAPMPGSFVQLGAFKNRGNAENLKRQHAGLGAIAVIAKPSASGVTLYHVRVGPFARAEEGALALQQARAAGIDARMIRE
jgi:rare lipoprotein A